MLSAKPTAIMGHVMRVKALQNLKKSPCDRPPASGDTQHLDFATPKTSLDQRPVELTEPGIGGQVSADQVGPSVESQSKIDG